MDNKVKMASMAQTEDGMADLTDEQKQKFHRILTIAYRKIFREVYNDVSDTENTADFLTRLMVQQAMLTAATVGYETLTDPVKREVMCMDLSASLYRLLDQAMTERFNEAVHGKSEGLH
jgi:hypothetical protein